MGLTLAAGCVALGKGPVRFRRGLQVLMECMRMSRLSASGSKV